MNSQEVAATAADDHGNGASRRSTHKRRSLTRRATVLRKLDALLTSAKASFRRNIASEAHGEAAAPAAVGAAAAGATDAIEAASDGVALWELAFSAAMSEAARRDAGFNPAMASVSKRHLPKFVDLREIVNRRRVQMASVIAKNYRIPDCFWRRIQMWKRVELGYREKFIRWEIIKLQMLEGCHVDGIIADSGAGRELRLPLKMRIILTNPETSYHHRLSVLNTSAVAERMNTMWDELALRGNITEPTYYALARVVVSTIFPHLREREQHQLILLDSAVDFPHSGVMTKRGFMRWVASLLMALMETHAVSEAVNFMQGLWATWERSLEFLDLAFHSRYSRKDPSLLIPAVTARVLQSDEATREFCLDQIATAVRIRFGTLLSDDSGALARGNKPVRLRKHRNRFVGAAGGGDGWPFFMSPSTDDDPAVHLRAADAAVRQDIRVVEAPPEPTETSPPGTASAAREERQGATQGASGCLGGTRRSEPLRITGSDEPGQVRLHASLHVGDGAAPSRGGSVTGSPLRRLLRLSSVASFVSFGNSSESDIFEGGSMVDGTPRSHSSLTSASEGTTAARAAMLRRARVELQRIRSRKGAAAHPFALHKEDRGVRTIEVASYPVAELDQRCTPSCAPAGSYNLQCGSRAATDEWSRRDRLQRAQLPPVPGRRLRATPTRW